MILQGDCLEHMKRMVADSVDSIVTDPPYGLAFMGKKWDYDVPSKELWIEVLRVLKPGGYLLSFGGTRTYHRMVVAIEDAGFEIRDQIQWLYGSGFPKSMDISKAIDKAAGAEREVVGSKLGLPGYRAGEQISSTVLKGGQDGTLNNGSAKLEITAPATPDAIKWQGFGTALKPANEPIVLARKPLSEKTVAANVLKHGTGGLNIDASRIGTSDNLNGGAYSPGERKRNASAFGGGVGGGVMSGANEGFVQPQGRFPANIILDEDAAEMLDAQSIAGGIHSAGKARDKKENFDQTKSMFGIGYAAGSSPRLDDGSKIGASRFFYVAKASKSERNRGCEGLDNFKCGKNQSSLDGGKMLTGSGNERSNLKQNFHPTIKPIKLMEYLIRLITPPGGVVLDPFMGSGSTGVAALNLGFVFIGIELNAEYIAIAERRIGTEKYMGQTAELIMGPQ